MTNEKIKEKILAEYEKGNICYRTIDGIMMQPMEWFTQQPLDGMLYDMNRDDATILTFLDDPKWTNDLALSRLLRYYHNRCQEFERNIWHKSDEKPKVPSRIVTVYGLIVDSWDYNGTKHSDDMLSCCNKWAYFSELIRDGK